MLDAADRHLTKKGRTSLEFLRRPWLLTILLASTLCIAYLVEVFVNWGDVADRSLFANLGMIPMGLIATILAGSASKVQTDQRSKWAWRLLAAGLGCFFLGDLLFFILQNVLLRSPFPSVADIGYLAYYPLALAGLLCFPSAIRGRGERVNFYLDCFLAFLAGGIVISYLFLIPTLHSARDNVLVYSLSAGYPIGDLLLLVGIAYLLLRKVRRQPLSALPLGGGLLVGLAADVIYGYQNIQSSPQSGGLSDALYMLSWALFAWAGYAEAVRARPAAGAVEPRPFGWLDRLLRPGFIVVGVVMILYVNRSLMGTDAGFVVLAAATLVLVSVLRQILGVLEAHELAKTSSKRETQ